ncbi:MAG: TetR/AcrR family transcriptional regulator [Lachnospiraceae bacterium]
MARKETIKKDYLINTAFLLAKQEGIENVTARKLAAKAGCSTQPIFRLYENMEDLWEEIFMKAATYFSFFYDRCPKVAEEPFVNLGIAYIQFAREEKELFRLLFLSENRYQKSMYELLNSDKGIVKTEIEKAKQDGCKDPGGLFTKMWIFIHGAACMSITGDYDLEEEQTVSLLKESYFAFR